ncbi:uncharacterized protein LOC116351834 isoform X2 [Contarinia nasturtii]|uniref:uncharacterized protein LOC116351834 isoform X2 n=1 Tax=Contarinia nasturtii TaxID=265458 RepID=UPI0012D42F7B|nr:uncharacterized protein LOC116351834 isoform X2 [Contarinia nasturtii]
MFFFLIVGPIITRDKRFLGIHSLSIPSHRLPEVGVLIPAYRAWIANPWELKTQVHKFMVALQYTKGYSDVRHTCGATIISNSKILTSARCVYGTRSITLLLATINSDEPYYSINVSDEQVFVHPDYDEDTFANNIAVLEIPLKFSSKVGKIDMIEKTSLASIKPCADVLMYGYMESNSPNRTYTETHLRSIDTKLANFSVCQDIYSGYVNLDKEKQFCLQSVEQCSGGPILTKSKKLLGIISHSTNGLPDVGTSVVGHRKFINNPRNFRPGSTAGGSGGQTSVPSRQTSRSSGSNVPSSSGSQTTENELVRKIEDNKYTAALLYKDDINGDRYLCSATIITNYKVLAAAHCLHNKYSVTLELGTLDTDIQYSTVNVSTQEIFVHPQYSADPIYVNDIAVILLKKALKFDSKIGKIDMVDKKYVIDTDDKVTLLGHSKGYLRYFNSTIAGFVGCRRSYWEKNNDNPWLEEDRQFCVTVHDGEENIGTGYSGGPVVTAGGKLIGIFSYDFNSLPEVCTSVIGHRSFIDDPKGFCVSDTETGRSNIQTGVSSRPTGGSSGSSSGGSSVTQASNSKLVDKIEDYKFVAAIISTKSGSGSRIVCGATVVSSFKVMTAASCVIDTEAVALIAGALNSEEPHQTVNITGKEIIIHPGHKGIAMIQLKSSLKFGTKIGKIDLVNVDYKPKDAEDVNIFGYLDNRLHFINTTIHDFVASRNNDDPKEDSQFYISSSTTDNRQNRQYAGGPVTTNGKVKKLIGIMSYGSDGLQPVCTLIEASKYREFILNPRIYAMKYRQKN